MNEKDLIHLITENLSTHERVDVGPGDDCAVVSVPSRFKNPKCVLKVDTIVEGVHFESVADPKRVGRKAIGRPLSDFAAMGTLPDSALVSLSLESPVDANWVVSFYNGLKELAEEFSIVIVGGETTSLPKGKVISVTVAGHTEENKYIPRSGAREGDAIFVTGELGGSLGGKHLDFTPRIKEGNWLRENFDIHGMMDLSDGLGSDLTTLLESSALGADLLKSAIPISKAAKERVRDGMSTKTPLEASMTDGEDYELLFTLPPSQAVKLKDSWKAVFPEVRISCIGKTSGAQGLRLQTEQGFEILRKKGFDHFNDQTEN